MSCDAVLSLVQPVAGQGHEQLVLASAGSVEKLRLSKAVGVGLQHVLSGPIRSDDVGTCSTSLFLHGGVDHRKKIVDTTFSVAGL
jgi:hypothetical protein